MGKGGANGGNVYSINCTDVKFLETTLYFVLKFVSTENNSKSVVTCETFFVRKSNSSVTIILADTMFLIFTSYAFTDVFTSSKKDVFIVSNV